MDNKVKRATVMTISVEGDKMGFLLRKRIVEVLTLEGVRAISVRAKDGAPGREIAGILRLPIRVLPIRPSTFEGTDEAWFKHTCVEELIRQGGKLAFIGKPEAAAEVLRVLATPDSLTQQRLLRCMPQHGMYCKMIRSKKDVTTYPMEFECFDLHNGVRQILPDIIDSERMTAARSA